MSASIPNSGIWLTDTEKQIRDKINGFAFSGGGASLNDQRGLGANLEVDVPFMWLKFFMEDDERLETIREEYSTGRMTSGEVKKELIAILSDITKAHQTARRAVTDEVVLRYTSIRPMHIPNLPPEVISPSSSSSRTEKEKDKGGAALKKEKGGAEKEKAAAPRDPMSRVLLKVGKIVSIEIHPESDHLFVEQIDCGDPAGPRTIVSGLRGAIPQDQLKDQLVVIAANLEPRKFKGVVSHGMVLCAVSSATKSGDGHDGDSAANEDRRIEIVQPPHGSAPGDVVSADGHGYDGVPPDEVLKGKGKVVWETISPGLRTDEDCTATWNGFPLVTGAGKCRVKSLQNVAIS